jgi:hypothetical protein
MIMKDARRQGRLNTDYRISLDLDDKKDEKAGEGNADNRQAQ